MADDVIEMRGRIAASATQWALVYPLANWGFWGFAKGEARDQIAAVAEDLAAAWGRDIADRVLAEMFTATDPGDDLHRQTVEHLGRAWPDLTEDPVYLDQLAHEALSVRWEHAVRQAVEVERLRKERDALKATIEQVRTDAEERLRDVGATDDLWLRGAYTQACRTLCIIRDALGHPHTHRGGL